MQTQALIETHRVRILGRTIGVAQFDAGPNSIHLQAIPNSPLEPADIILPIQSDRSFKLAGPDKLVRNKPTAGLKARAAAVKDLWRWRKPEA